MHALRVTFFMKSSDSAGVWIMPGKSYSNPSQYSTASDFGESELLDKVLSIKIQQFLGYGYPEEFERELSWLMYFGLRKHVVVTVNNGANVLM